MKRYRFTLLAICLVLAWLGYHDLKTFFANPEPLAITLSDLEQNGAPREWLQITDGSFDLEQAINPSGEVDTFESGPFFVPMAGPNGSSEIRVVVETRRPEVIDILRRYVLDFRTAEEQQEFLKNNRDAFHPQQTVTGMTSSWLSATANRDKLLELAKKLNMTVSQDVIFISEGKEPGRFRGFFFAIVAFFGMVKAIQMIIRKQSGLAVNLPDDGT